MPTLSRPRKKPPYSLLTGRILDRASESLALGTGPPLSADMPDWLTSGSMSFSVSKGLAHLPGPVDVVANQDLHDQDYR